jgi:hypothetical protein
MTAAAGFLVVTNGGIRPVPVATALTVDPAAATETIALDHTRWQSIVIHHSGTPSGSPDSLDRAHRSIGFASLGYHFVIGNGIDFGDGAVARGPRWIAQQPGAHVRERAAGATPDAAWFNEHGIAICLIGNGERRTFTDAQVRSLIDLVTDLQREFGIPDSQVFLHSDLTNATSPGRFFPVAAFETALAQ